MKKPIFPLLLAVLFCSVFVSRSEVSVEKDGSNQLVGLAHIYNLGGGAEDPWPTVRRHIPGSWILNPNGSFKDHPDGKPALGWNPATKAPEVVWPWFDGIDYEIVCSRWAGDHWTPPETLTSNGTDDRDPDLAFAPDGTARISFWDGSRVRVMERPVGGEWSPAEDVDVGFHPVLARSPAIWVAYQQHRSGNETAVIVAKRGDGWTPEQLAVTGFSGFEGNGDLDLRISTLGDRTWVVWEHSAGNLSWSVLESDGSWSAPEAEPVGEPGGEEAARARIQRKVLSR